MHAGGGETTEAAPDADLVVDDAITPVSDGAPPRLSSWLAIGLGVCVTVVNIALAIRIWKFLFARAASGSLLFALMLSTFALGLFLIAYGVILLRSRGSNHDRGQHIWDLSGAAVLLTGAAAFVITIWAANVIEPDQPAPQNPKTCIDVYQQAIAIHQASPGFRLTANDPDQRRCDVNAFLRYIGK